MNILSEPNSIPIHMGLITLCLCVLTAKAITHLNAGTNIAQDRLGCIDGLRGFLALGVFLHHYVVTYHFHLTGIWTVPSSAFYTLTGQVAVCLFFMVTGFLFWNKILVGQGRVDWLKLYLSRIFRLFPLYWSVVTVIGILVIYMGGSNLRVPLLSLVKSILAWLFLFWGAKPPEINAFQDTYKIVACVTWTLKYECFFYISLPVLALIFRMFRKSKVLLWIYGCCIAGISMMEFSIPYLYINTQYFFFFLAGAISASIYNVGIFRTIAQSTFSSCISILSMLLLFSQFSSVYGIWQVLIMVIFFSSVALGNSLLGLLKLPALRLLGEISYSLYLLHGLFLYICFSVVLPKFMGPVTPSIQVAFAMPAVGSLLVLFSWVSFSKIERPFMRIGKNLSGHISQTLNEIIMPKDLPTSEKAAYLHPDKNYDAS